MDKQLVKLLNHTVQVEPFLKPSGTGAPDYASPKKLTCYISGECKMVRDVLGEEVVSNDTLYFDATTGVAIGLKDRITLPSGRQPPIIRIRTYFDERGKGSLTEVNL